MKYLCIILTLCLTFIQHSCKIDEKDILNSIQIIKIDVEEFQSIEDLNFSKIKSIALSSNEDYLFGDIDKCIFTDKYIFIKPRDNDKILIFSETGQGVNILNNVGKGVGEFESIVDFDVDMVNQRILIVDPGNRKVLMYTLDGTFIRDFLLNQYIKLFKTVYCQDQTVNYAADVGYSNLNADLSDSYSFLLLDSEFQVFNRYFPFEIPKRGFNGDLYKFFSCNTEIAGYYKCFTDTIFHIDCMGLTPKYQLKFNHPIIKYSDFEELISNPNMENFEFIMDIKYLENQDYVIIVYAYKHETYVAVYTKETNEVKNYKVEKHNECYALDIFPLLTTMDRDYLVFKGTPGSSGCLTIFNNVSGADSIIGRLESMDENLNAPLILATLEN